MVFYLTSAVPSAMTGCFLMPNILLSTKPQNFGLSITTNFMYNDSLQIRRHLIPHKELIIRTTATTTTTQQGGRILAVSNPILNASSFPSPHCFLLFHTSITLSAGCYAVHFSGDRVNKALQALFCRHNHNFIGYVPADWAV